jgi:hypothetical protein
MSSDNEQKSELVRQHKRIAQGVPLDGTSMGGKTHFEPKKQGALSQAQHKKK